MYSNNWKNQSTLSAPNDISNYILSISKELDCLFAIDVDDSRIFGGFFRLRRSSKVRDFSFFNGEEIVTGSLCSNQVKDICSGIPNSNSSPTGMVHNMPGTLAPAPVQSIGAPQQTKSIWISSTDLITAKINSHHHWSVVLVHKWSYLTVETSPRGGRPMMTQTWEYEN